MIAKQLACILSIYLPNRGQYSGYMICLDPSEASIHVTWSSLTNQRPDSRSCDLNWPIRGQYLPVPQAPLGPKNNLLMIFHRFWTNTWLLFCWVKTLLYLIDSSLSFSLKASMYWEVNWSLLSPISRFRLCCETYRETFFWKLLYEQKYGFNW